MATAKKFTDRRATWKNSKMAIKCDATYVTRKAKGKKLRLFKIKSKNSPLFFMFTSPEAAKKVGWKRVA